MGLLLNFNNITKEIKTCQELGRLNFDAKVDAIYAENKEDLNMKSRQTLLNKIYRLEKELRTAEKLQIQNIEASKSNIEREKINIEIAEKNRENINDAKTLLDLVYRELREQKINPNNNEEEKG